MSEHLNALLVSEKDIASDVMTSVLRDLINVGKESGKIIPTASFEKLDRNSKILVFLLGLRAASMLGVGNKIEASVDEISEVVGIDSKSVGEYVSRLKRKYLVRSDSGYSVPTEKLRLVCHHITSSRQL
jgi:hypothetical protein